MLRTFQWVSILTLGVINPGPAVMAGEILFARDNGYYREKEEPARFQALALVDGDAKSAWCSAGNGQGAWLMLRFSESLPISRLDIRNGALTAAGSPKAFSRVRSLSVSDGETQIKLNLEDKSEPQTFRLDPPLQGKQLELRLETGYRGESQPHACLAEVEVFSSGRPLSLAKGKPPGKSPAEWLPFLDVWSQSRENVRERELVLGAAGVFIFTYRSLDSDQPTITKRGRWQVIDDGLELLLKGQPYTAVTERDESGKVLALLLDDEPLIGRYLRSLSEPRKED